MLFKLFLCKDVSRFFSGADISNRNEKGTESPWIRQELQENTEITQIYTEIFGYYIKKTGEGFTKKKVIKTLNPIFMTGRKRRKKNNNSLYLNESNNRV